MFSFKINKKVSSSSSGTQVQKVTSIPLSSKKAFNDEDDKEEDDRDFIHGLEGNEILSKTQKKAEKKQLVIPLITKNEWRIDKKREEEDGEHRKRLKDPEKESTNEKVELSNEVNKTEAGIPGDSLKDQAIKELLEEAQSGGSGDKKSTRSIPLLLQNKVPDGYEEEENMDVSLRPDQSTLEDYDRIPIEEFGMAMLRGMGWKEDEGIGLRNKKVVDMPEPKLRPKGMGLGAEPSHIKDATPKSASKGNENQKEDLTLKLGAYAMVNRGSKNGHYGQVESFDEDNNRVILRLAISGKMEAVSKFYIEVVSSDEYKKSSKVINKGKYEEYKNKQENGESYKEKQRETDKRRSRSRSSPRSSSDERESGGKSRRKERDHYYDSGDDYKRDKKRSHHRSHHDDEKKSSRNSRKDTRYDSSDDERDRRKSHKNSSDDYYKSSSRNGDKHDSYYSSKSRKEKDDYHRDRKHGHSSRKYRD